MMPRRIFSLETEYGLALDSEQAPTSASVLYDPLEAVLRARHTTIPCSTVNHHRGERRTSGLVELKEGFFLQTGARIYYDSGHLEWACPECGSAWDAVVWDQAADRELEAAASGARSPARIMVLKNNVTYLTGVSYGCHENYSIPRHLSRVGDFFAFLTDALPAFLVTRGIFCGAGRLGTAIETPDAPQAYQITQRADFMQEVVSHSAREDRGILNDRDEPLANQTYRRLHLIVGDSNLSPWSTLLKLGSTGLVLDALEAGLLPNPPLLLSPLDTLHAVSRDLGCTMRYPLRSGEQLTAVEIQKRYWQAAKQFTASLPTDDKRWQILALWNQALDDLEVNPARLADRADWCIKQRFYETQILPRLHTYWEELAAWAWIIEQTLIVPEPPLGFDPALWLGHHLTGPAWRQLQIALVERNLRWNDYARQRRNFLALRQMDVRLHDLDRRHGLFYRFHPEDGGVNILPHEIERARSQAPSNTRAWLRGQVIDSPGRNQVAAMDWNRVTLRSGQTFALDDPFASEDAQLAHLFGF
jgi:hypothetical protein